MYPHILHYMNHSTIFNRQTCIGLYHQNVKTNFYTAGVGQNEINDVNCFWIGSLQYKCIQITNSLFLKSIGFWNNSFVQL